MWYKACFFHVYAPCLHCIDEAHIGRNRHSPVCRLINQYTSLYHNSKLLWPTAPCANMKDETKEKNRNKKFRVEVIWALGEVHGIGIDQSACCRLISGLILHMIRRQEMILTLFRSILQLLECSKLAIQLKRQHHQDRHTVGKVVSLRMRWRKV